MSCEAQCTGGGLRNDAGAANKQTVAPHRQGIGQHAAAHAIADCARLHQFPEIFAEPRHQGALGFGLCATAARPFVGQVH